MSITFLNIALLKYACNWENHTKKQRYLQVTKFKHKIVLLLMQYYDNDITNTQVNIARAFLKSFARNTYIYFYTKIAS